MAQNANQKHFGSKFLPIIGFIYLSLIDVTESCLGLKTIGVTSPAGDISIEHGHKLEILCILNEDYVKNEGEDVIKNFIFKRNNETLPDAMISIVDRRTLRLHIEKPPPSQSMYYCVDRRNDNTVCLNNVFVGTKPIDITDFSCIGHNFVNLTCSWTAPKNYIKTNYTLEYHFPGRSSRSHFSCPKIEPKNWISVKSTKMKCFWDLSTHPLYRQTQATYFFKLIAQNEFGRTTIDYNFTHFANVIPDAPTNVTILNKTTDSILLQWNIPFSMRMFPPGLIHRIQYQDEYNQQWKTADTTSLPHKNITYRFNLTGLPYAHSLYDIRISARSAKSDENDEMKWSNFASITPRTKSKLPGSPPQVNMGGFEFSNKIGEVIIYWQYIPDWMKNGENQTYKITVYEDSIERDLKPNELTRTYAVFSDIVSTKNYKFDIATVNEIGQSRNVSSITIPAYDKRIPEPKVLSKIAFNSTYELSWLPPSLNDDMVVDNYTIFWCNNNRDRPFLCDGYLRWIEVPANITSYNVTVNDAIYQFAISANTKYGSSGMVWTTCTVIPMNGGGIGKMKNLWIDHLGPTFIHVSWKIGCSDYVAGIKGFKIYYCPIISPVDSVCRQNEQKILSIDDPSASEANVTQLKPYTTYMLSVAVVTKHNSNVLQSDRLYNTTLEAVPDSPPQNITVTKVTNSSIALTWLPPINIYGVLKYYEVTYSPKGYGVDVKIVEPIQQEFILDKLKSFTEYTISIKACTVGCSVASKPLRIRTAVTTPGQMRPPSVNNPNVTLIQISWAPPEIRGGEINLYELRIKEKTSSGNTTKIINTTDLKYTIPNCHEDETFRVYYFSIRAINFDQNKTYKGPWSIETENYCQAPPKYIYIILIGIILFILMGAMIAYGVKMLWQRCKRMRDIDIKLPGNLETQLNIQWTAGTKDNLNKHNSPNSEPANDDDQRLLDTKVDSVMSGDSSGCSSCQDSVHSSLASGSNLSAGTDSGTEQPKSASNNDDTVSKADSSSSREGSLRLRKTVTQAPNYCVLGVGNTSPETNTSSGYVPIPKTTPYIQASEIKRPVTHSPYVIAVDSKQLVAKDKPQTSELGYSSIVPTSTLINIDQGNLTFGQPITNNSGGDISGPYVKNDWSTVQSEIPTNDFMLHNSYCRLGIDGKSIIPKMPLADSSDLITDNLTEEPIQKSSTRVLSEPVKGYVPHKHFDSKMLKGD